ncbi:DUF6397 family protein [Streptomyces ochraceiscleroticus]|uniref:DUF6397 family protein n=1 Tax=Streptomyces ochraceiscleroticus TaxID=47761 RepID=A0ABW1MTC7_9ACTN|nr:DUF6397 family protein [Streptomyces ochraceiscleroticus]
MTAMYDGSETLAMGRAARELGLKTGEFELATQLEEVITVLPGPGGAPGRRRVPAAEVERLREEEGFPDTLRERIRVVGATEGAELLGIAPGRFLRLARAGCFGPVRFYVNRYGAIVWQYLAAELQAFAGREFSLIHGPTPPPMRELLTRGQDWRGRLWRSRRVAQLVEEADGSWAVSAVIAAVLPPEELASLVRDPAERAWLRKLRPRLSSAGANTNRTREAVERAETAEEFDEVMWYRISLSRQLDAARQEHPAPPLSRPGAAPPRPAFDESRLQEPYGEDLCVATGPMAADPDMVSPATASSATASRMGATNRGNVSAPAEALVHKLADHNDSGGAPSDEVAVLHGPDEAPPHEQTAPNSPDGMPSGAVTTPNEPGGALAPEAAARRARLIRARTGTATTSRTRPRTAATGGVPTRSGTDRPGSLFARRRAGRTGETAGPSPARRPSADRPGAPPPGRGRGFAGRSRPQSPSLRKSPSWTTETSSLPSRS